MPKCAYCGNEINDDKIVVICKNGCYRTNFLCSCKTMNRTTAFYCRFCGKEVSYNSALQSHTKNLEISQSLFDNTLFELNLSEFGISSDISDLPMLYSSFGNLFLIFKTGSIVILKSGNGELQTTIDLPDRISTLPIEVCDQVSKNLFILTSGKIYRIDLVRDFKYEDIMEIGVEGAELNLQSLYFDGYFFLVVKQNSVNYIKIISLDGDQMDIISIDDLISQPVRAGNKAFFYTNDRIFIYDHSKRGIVYENKNTYQFTTKVEPKSSGNLVYVMTSGGKLFRVNLNEDMPEIFGLPHPQLMQMHFEATEKNIIIAHSRGVSVTNILGQMEWSSDDLLDPYPAYKFTPTCFGKYITFIMNYPNTEILHLIETDEFKQVSSCSGNFVSRPLYDDGNLYIVVDENGEIIMRAYEL